MSAGGRCSHPCLWAFLLSHRIFSVEIRISEEASRTGEVVSRNVAAEDRVEVGSASGICHYMKAVEDRL